MMSLKFINNSHCLSCLNYPTCRNTIWLPGSIVKEATTTARTCAKCGPQFKCVKYTLRSFRHSAVLDQRFIGEDGLTYETCLMCDASFQDLCDVNRAMLSPDGPRGNATHADATRRPAVTRNNTLAINQTVPRVARNNTLAINPTVPRDAPAIRPPLTNVNDPQRNRPLAPPPPPVNNRNSEPPAHGTDTVEVKCSKCNQVARK